MDNEHEQQQEQQAQDGQQQEQPAQDAQQEQRADAQDDAGKLTDKHGQEAIARGRYERDMRERDARIAELTAKLDEAAKTEAARAELAQQVDGLKAQIEADKLTYQLNLAGCRNDKAAKALIGDYGGDVDKLRDACPYLFETDTKQTGATGGANAGSQGSDALDAAFAKAFRVK